MRKRFFYVLAGLLAVAVVGLTGSAHAQSGFDRRGGDYASFQVKSGDPAECASRCEREGRCRAWSFSYPRTANAQATCWLKSSVPPPVAAKCCVSGVRGAAVDEPRANAIESSIDRLGGDYRDFDMAPDPTAAACRAACEGENKCRAWTYVRPGYIGQTARCFLKDRITPPRRKPCCLSGVVR